MMSGRPQGFTSGANLMVEAVVGATERVVPIHEGAKQAFEAASTAATEGIKEVVREDDEDPGRQRVFLGWWVTQLNAGRDMSATFRYRRQHGSAA